MNKQKSVASIVIHNAAEMNYEQRRSIASWLVRNAKMLRKIGKSYSKRFTSRYLYYEVDKQNQRQASARLS